MKVLVLNYSDAGGGASNAARRLVKALNENGTEAKLGVVDKLTENEFVIKLPWKKKLFIQRLFFRLNKILKKLFNKINIFSFQSTNHILHSTNNRSIIDINWINNSDFDVVNLHWINSDMISIKDIAKINKPICWTMHDTWPYCGAEHYPNMLENDERYKQMYTKYNKPASTTGKDICRKVWEQKKKYLSDKSLVFISPSQWEYDGLKSSSLFSKNDCYIIRNILDNTIFTKKDKTALKKAFNIPLDKKIIGFGAAYNIDDPKAVKGSFYLVEALKEITNPQDYFLVIFGPTSEKFLKNFSIPFFATGQISNELILSTIYNLCDVFVCPSIVENLPYTCLESLFCQVPIVAFNAGGTGDIVEHKVTGYLSTPYDIKDLIRGIEFCYENKSFLSENCLVKAKSEFDIKKIVSFYCSVYKKTIDNFRK